MQKVVVIGMGMSSRDLTQEQIDVIRSADVLVGGRRHLDQFEDLGMEKQVITGKVDEIIAFIRERMADRRVVVLASGDPLFFGIGERIVRDIGGQQVTFMPNISSIAAAFARIHEPWGEAKIVSLHGRDRRFELLEAMKSDGPVAVFTDARQSPAWLAQWLMARGVTQWQMAVFEQLGTAQERFGWYDLERSGRENFAQPNVVILKPKEEAFPAQKGVHLGMQDDAFEHERGLITKSEVRAVSLAKLQLKPGLTLWDLGAGSGSVGIEAAALIGAGRIIAVEQKSQRVDQIRKNARRHGVYNFEAVQAKLPDGLQALPRPDRIFIGGGGRGLADIICSAADRLAHDGRMVVNTVLMDNLGRALEAMQQSGLAASVVQVQINNGKAMPWSLRFEAHNPVWIITGVR